MPKLSPKIYVAEKKEENRKRKSEEKVEDVGGVPLFLLKDSSGYQKKHFLPFFSRERQNKKRQQEKWGGAKDTLNVRWKIGLSK